MEEKALAGDGACFRGLGEESQLIGVLLDRLLELPEILLGVGPVGIEVEGGLVILKGIIPEIAGAYGFGIEELLAEGDAAVGEIVEGAGLEARFGIDEGIGESVDGVLELAGAVGGDPVIVVNAR